MTNREVVSRIEGQLKFVHKDDRIPRRLILRTALSISTTYHSQKLLDKTLFREDSLFTYLKCVELEPVKGNICKTYIQRCNSLMRSKEKLPKLVYSRFGDSVISVTNIDDSVSFSRDSSEAVNEKLSTRYSHLTTDKPSFFIEDGYLYIPNYDIKAVNVVLISLQRDDTDSAGTGCTSAWDYTFVCSDKLLEPILQGVINNFAGTTAKIVEDENPNLDSNSKQ